MANKQFTDEIKLLFRTAVADADLKEVSQNVKNALQNAVIGFDEAEIKKNLEPVVRMMQNLFEKAEMKFNADELLAMPSKQALQKMANIEVDQLQAAFQKALSKNGGINLGLDNIDMSAITQSLDKISKDVVKIGKQIAGAAKKSVGEVESAIRDINRYAGKEGRKLKNIVSAENIEDMFMDADSDKKLSANKAINSITNAAQAYQKSVKDKNPWVVQYKYLYEFMSKYERLNKNTMDKINQEMPELQDLYKRWAPQMGNVRQSLEDYVVTIRGEGELSQYKNQPWGRESTLKEVRDILKGGISVKDNGGSSDGDSGDNNKSKLKPPIAEPPKKPKPITVYRGIHAEDEEDALSSRDEYIKRAGGAEAFSTKRAVAESYAVDWDEGAVLIGKVLPKNPLIIDASKHTFREFDKMPGIKEVFPEVIDKINDGTFDPSFGADEIQEYINSRAKEMGYDDVVMHNVYDSNNAESENVLSDVHFVIDDAILEITGSYARTPNEEIDFATKKGDVPDYYKTPVAHTGEVEIVGDNTKKTATTHDNIQIILDDMNKFLSSNKDKEMKDYFDLIASGAYEMSDDVKAAIEATIGSVDSLNSINIGANNHVGGINKSDVDLGKTQELIKTEEYLVDLQNRVNGEPISTIGEAIEGINPNVLNATTTSVQSLVQAMRELYDVGVEVDVENLGNILYDGQNDKFGIVDMGIHKEQTLAFESSEEMLMAFAQTVRNQVEDITDILNDPQLAQAWSRFADMVDGVVGTYIQPQTEITQPMAKAGARQENSTDIVSETQAQEKLNEVKNQSPSAKDDTDVHNANTEAIERETQATKRLKEIKNGVTMASFDAEHYDHNADSQFDFIQDTANQHKTNLLSYLGDDPGQTENELKLWSQQIQDNIKPINETVSRISKMSAVPKELKTTEQLYQEAAKVGQQIQTMYDDGITDTEEYIALQHKLLKIFDKIAYSYGGVKGAGAKDRDELNQWMYRSIKDDTGFDFYGGSLVDALYEGTNSIYANGKKQSMGAMAANFLNYNGDVFGGSFGFDQDLKTLKEINTLLDVINKRRDYLFRSPDTNYYKVETNAINQQNEALKENIGLKEHTNEQNVVTPTDADIEPKIIDEPDVKKSTGGAEVKASIDTEELRTLLNAIIYNVKVVQDVEPTEGNKVSIDAAELKSVLDSVVYNVKMAHSDTDKEANKIAIDEGALESILKRITYDVKIAHSDSDKESNKIAIDEKALESTLQRVFSGVLRPKDSPDKPKDKKEPWALEKTLLSVKNVLDQIQSNTLKKESIEVAPASTDIGNVLATENTLMAIKTAIESINSKVVKGGVIATRGAVKQAGAQSVEPDVKVQAARSNMMKSLINDYKAMGKLAAQFAGDNNLETKAMLENLKEEIRRKRASLNITMDENANLREKYSIAFEAEKRLLEAEKQQKAIVKAEKKRLADAKKLAQREAMLGKAGSAVGRAENTWVNAVGVEDELPPNVRANIDEYYQKLDDLRKKHNELKSSDMISEEQKKDLIAQTMEINKMTDEIGELISEYQRLSGDNASVIGTNTLRSNATVEAYQNQLKQAAIAATNGSAQIKKFDAATKTLTYTVKTGKNEFTEYTAAVRRADGALVSIQGATKKTETFMEATKRKMKEISSYMSGMAMLSRVTQELRRGIQYVREIDLALTELKKVTNETEEVYDKFLDTAAKTADKVGSTIQKVVSSTADWARLG